MLKKIMLISLTRKYNIPTKMYNAKLKANSSFTTRLEDKRNFDSLLLEVVLLTSSITGSTTKSTITN